MMSKISAQTKESVAQLLQTWNENKEHLPEKLVSEMDRLLDKVGLARKATAKTKSSDKPVAAKPAKKAAAPKKAPAKKKTAAKKSE